MTANNLGGEKPCCFLNIMYMSNNHPSKEVKFMNNNEAVNAKVYFILVCDSASYVASHNIIEYHLTMASNVKCDRVFICSFVLSVVFRYTFNRRE